MILATRGTQPVEVVDYDQDWPRRYATERDRIRGAIGDTLLVIEHVGGTAVPGLPAKPVIDLMVGVEDIERAGPAVAGLLIAAEIREAQEKRDEWPAVWDDANRKKLRTWLAS